MGTIRKFNGSEWISVASDKATEISTENPSLLENSESIVSVDTVLLRLKEDVNTLKGNVSWLALHGGGGSGTGGGGGSTTISEATCDITVNGRLTNNQISMNSDGLTILLTNISILATKSWLVVIRIGSLQIYSGSASFTNPTIVLDLSRVSSYLINHTGNLSVAASYEDDTNAIYGVSSWQGAIFESVVNLLCNDVALTLDTLELEQIIYEYSVGIIGEYTLKIETTKNSTTINTFLDTISITTTNTNRKSILFSDLIGEINDPTSYIGVYKLKATLTYSNNSAVTKTITSSATLASTDILIAASTMGTLDEPSETVVGGALKVNFTAYVLGASSYQCEISVNNVVERTGLVGYFSEPFSQILSTSGKTWAIENNVVPIKIKLTSGDKYKEETFYTKIVAASSSFIDYAQTVIESSISDFKARNYSLDTSEFNLSNNNFVSGGTKYSITSKLHLGNGNALSGIQFTNDVPYLRLRNGAYGILDSWTLTNASAGRTLKLTLQLLFRTSNEFTISLCFKADYHPDDERTILYCGTVNKDTGKIVKGLSIDVHDLYINGNSVAKLTDNVINCVDIVCLKTEVNDVKSDGTPVHEVFYIIKVYLDGVLTSISKDVANADGSGFPTSLGDCIYLGTRFYTVNGEEKADYLCDCNIYNLLVYDHALTDIDLVTHYINNKVSTEYIGGQPNFSIISSELLKNFAERDSQTNTLTSQLFLNGLYTIDFLLNANGLDEDNLNTFAKSIGIPVMLIDVVTDSEWTFDNFVLQQTAKEVSLSQTSGRTVQYWDPTQNNSKVLTINDCSVELQGTSTLADSVKNLNITVPDSTCFIPKAHWLPEQTYTLKADVVDSSHSNNASIGKFINEVLGYNETQGSSYLPFDATAISNVYDSDYKKNLLETATLKHTVEGFPVLLIMKFNPNSLSKISVTPLGIYSFNLGRDAYRNLGFKKLNSVKSSAGETPVINAFPFVLEEATFNEIESNANWIEIKDTTSIKDMEDVTNSFPTNFDSSKGDFWQNDDAILDARYEVRYPLNKSTHEYTSFKNFVGNIMSLPIEGTFSTDSLGNVTRPQITGAFDTYTVDATNNYSKKGSLNINTDVNTIPTDLGFNIESAYKYFIIALFFGLVDNFGKNSTYRSWNSGKYFVDFYDLDTALGGSNQGLLAVDPDIWIKYLMNDIPDGKNYGYLKETFKNIYKSSLDSATNTSKLETSVQKTVSANHNKLWLSLDTLLFRQYTGSGNSSIYAELWHNFRTYLQNTVLAAYNTANGTTYTNFADFFIDLYYQKLTGLCGPLLFNYDYKLKYLVLFYGNEYKTTKDLTKLHGRKIAYSRDWLKKHILFLDSLFYWRDNTLAMTYINNVNTRGANSVLNTPESFPMKTNTSLIVHNSVGNTTQTFYYMPKNTQTYINAGSNTSGSVLNWNFSNSPNIIEFGSKLHPLSEMNIVTLSCAVNNASFDVNGYPAITELNFSENKAFGTGFDLSAFELGNISELRILDFSKTSGNDFNLALNKVTSTGENYTKYEKLREIDISESKCITNLTIPSVPLTSLKLFRSSITNFELNKQKYLTLVDLSGCTQLINVGIKECGAYLEFSVNGLTNLTKVEILQCSDIETISITNCSGLSLVNIEGCPKLKYITITGCNSLTNLVNISDCTSLLTINFRDDTNLTYFNIAKSNLANITTLNLYNTKVTHIIGDSADTSILDISKFESLTSFNIQYNSLVTKIKFANKQNYAIPLNTRFIGCNKLERIYGHVLINAASMFRDCTVFKLLGDSIKLANGTTISAETEKRPMLEIINPTHNTPSLDLLFMSGSDATNVKFGNVTNVLSEICFNTKVTRFDMYYLLNTFALSGVTASLSISYSFWSAGIVFDTTYVPHRQMFYGCLAITSMTYFVSSSKATILLGPSHNDNGTITEDNGLFSPLVNLTRLYTWYNTSLYCSKYLMRRKTENYPITSFDFMYMVLIDDNADTEATTTSTSLGDLSGFFDQMPNLTSITGSFNINRIDFDTLVLPNKITDIHYSFRVSAGRGTIELSTIFSNPSIVKNICNSFIINGTATTYNTAVESGLVYMPINDDTLKLFTLLVNLGANQTRTSSNPYSGRVYDDGSRCEFGFCGSGLHKYVSLDNFPYNIFEKCTKLQSVVGFFAYLKAGSLESPISMTFEFPKNLFNKLTELATAACFLFDCGIPYTLTGEGFAKCTNLNNVTKMCAASAGTLNSKLTGYIPYRFLYHGGYSKTVSISGSNEETVDENTTVQSSSWTYFVPNNKIEFAAGLFEGSVYIEAYKQTPPNNVSTDVQFKNDLYSPYKWIYNNGSWTEATEAQEYKINMSWIYNGDYADSVYGNLKTSDYGYYDNTNWQIVTNTQKEITTVNYICAPDLLKYCTANARINNLFYYCGASESIWGWAGPGYKLGISGRIPPYLFINLPNITNVDRVFEYCRNLTSVKNSGSSSSYLIPTNLFANNAKITSLICTFGGMRFDTGTVLTGIFSPLSKNSIDIRGIFHSCIYDGDTISGVFSGNKCGYISGAFAYAPVTLKSSAPYAEVAINHSYSTSNAAFSNNFSAGNIPALSAIGYLYYGNSSATESAIDLSVTYNKS